MIAPELNRRIAAFTVADDLVRAGLYPYFQVIDSIDGPVARIRGKRVLMFGSNSYMGLTNHPRVKQAVCMAAMQFGSSCSGSRFLNGTTSLHTLLEERLADFLGKEAALVFTTGYQANLGVVSSLTGRNGVLLLDEMDHASIIDGSRLSFSRVLKFRHNDMNHLESLLLGLDPGTIRMIVVDGVFSMEGDVARLPELVDLARRHNALLMVDDAHGIGVMGKNGQGTASHFGVSDGVDLIMGTFSKSLASLGGFVAGERRVINYLKHHARSMIFSASIPASAAAAAIAALEVVVNEPERVARLWNNTLHLTEGLRASGLHPGDAQTPIVPVYVRDETTTFRMTNRLLQEGVFVNPVVPPAVRAGQSLIRLSVMATHTRSQINFAIDKIYRVARELGLLQDQTMEAVYAC